MQVYLKTLGCRLNEAELEIWAQAFQSSGHSITNQVQNAHIIIINSCAVTQDAVRKSRQLIRRIHRDNPQAKLVVSGCYATLNTDEAQNLLGVDLVVSNKDKSFLVEKTLSELNMETMPAMATEPASSALFNRGRQRAFVKVQDGCRYRCTFCIVTIARGEEVSRSVSEIIDEINTLHAQGINEVILTGVHLGGYGSDNNENLVSLIQTILEKTTIARLRLGSLEPWEFNDDFFALFKNLRLMPHLHLPLQSGSDSVLRRMARRCKTVEFKEILDKLRTEIPHFNITTDIIVGFPDESEQEWRESVEFIKQCQFGHIHIFTYSPREGTKAATLPNPISQQVKKLRSEQLHQIAHDMKQQFYQNQLTQTFSVLWEGQSQNLENGLKRVFGYTPNYLRVACDVNHDTDLENFITQAQLIEMQDDFMLSQLV